MIYVIYLRKIHNEDTDSITESSNDWKQYQYIAERYKNDYITIN